jgi:hypothetical protein
MTAGSTFPDTLTLTRKDSLLDDEMALYTTLLISFHSVSQGIAVSANVLLTL